MKISLLFLSLIISTAHAQLFKVSDKADILSETSTKHLCVLDDKTKLLWEVKLNTKGLQNTQNTYTWFDGKTGVENGDYSHNCHLAKNCNTQAYIKAINNMKLCQQTQWRLPTKDELKTILLYGDDDLLVNKTFFNNTQLKSYWSSTELSDDIAIDVPFFYGGSQSADKFFDAHIRLVSDAN